jgi:hypothetical protein
MTHENVKPDIHKAKALEKMADELYERVKFFSIQTYPSANISDYYDIIHMLLEAISANKGFRIKGDSAHIKLIEEANKRGIISIQEKSPLQELRNLRNKFKYEGFTITKEFALRNEKKLQKCIERIKINLTL